MGIAAGLFYSTLAPENCLDWRIRPSDVQYDAQKQRWNDVADHLLADLAQRSQCTTASWLQGSYKFGTQVRPASKDHEFDIDLGIYFKWPGQPHEGPHAPTALKAFVQKSLQTYAEDDTNEAEAEDEPRAKCSRIHFKDGFHIDVPAYHLDDDRDARSLATDKDEWEDSDPKAIYQWWKDSLSDLERPRCRRMVRYLKMWAALKFTDKTRPSSILLTVLTANAYLQIDRSSLSGDDEIVRAIVARITEQLEASTSVSNPSCPDENLNRLSDQENENLKEKLGELLSIADRALNVQTKMGASDIWSEAFGHFFPIPSEEEIKEEALVKANDSRSLARIGFEPIVSVSATSGTHVFTNTDKIGPIPKGCDITFTLANPHMLPSGATINWTVRNSGSDAENENDLGHYAGEGLSVTRPSAYRGNHYMDVAVKLNGLLIGSRRVPVIITGAGIPPRNSPRPAWTKLRRK